ncbi:MAG: gamma-glutamylcyclotransferase [Sandaracinaceae bacterium]
MLYFGYGSNLCAVDFARWCEARGHTRVGVRPVGVGWLPDHEVVFHYHSRARRGGALSVRPRRGSSVPGVLYEVDAAGWVALDHKEGAPDFYARVAKDAITEAGDEVRVTTYEVVEARRQASHVPPTEEYVETVRRGLAAHALPDDQVVAAARSLRTPPLPRAIFVYGTLMRGQLREPCLGRYAPERWEPARARGRLVHLGAYPGLLPDERAEVRGELVTLGDPGDALRELDEIEDFLGYGREGSLYRRVVTRAHTARGAELAWTYRYLGDGTVIPSGDWRSV